MLVTQPNTGIARTQYYGSDSYRNQGQEKDDEVSGKGNSYTTEFRQYDSRLGRWLSIDPLMAKFPWQSPYVAFDNNPIVKIDSKGKSGIARVTDKKSEEGYTIIEVKADYFIYGSTDESMASTMQINLDKQYNNEGQFFVICDEEGNPYQIRFEFNVKIVDKESVDRLLVPGKYSEMSAKNNFYEIVDKNIIGKDAYALTLTGGYSGNTGAILKSKVTTPTVGHEVNHGFNGDDNDGKSFGEDKNDITIQTGYLLNPDGRKVTDDNVQSIFNNNNFDFKSKEEQNLGVPRPDLYDSKSKEQYRRVNESTE